TLVAMTVPTGEPVHKVSIIPRGVGALGYTLQLPVKEKFLATRLELLDQGMAICLAETSGGKVKWGDKQLLRRGIKQASYGIMQVRLQTARFVAKKYNLLDIRMMSDTQIITKMMHDTIFNAKIAVLYLVYLSDSSKSYFEAVSRYNGGRVNYPYYNKVQRCLKIIRRHGL
ncbi:MAG TPA: hypothetical protein ENK97_02745, partial [Campylobacteraceae bacterium]|nr:hypothetical protein [Campylobacteraceae bacterium]